MKFEKTWFAFQDLILRSQNDATHNTLFLPCLGLFFFSLLFINKSSGDKLSLFGWILIILTTLLNLGYCMFVIVR